MKTPSCICGLAACTLVVSGLPASITRHPANLSVSLGATAQFRVYATSTAPPLTYQWFHDGAALAGATKTTLILTNVQLSHGGSYSVSVTDAGGTVNSDPAILDVDPTFTQITTGDLVNDKRSWYGQAWGDYDQDGDLDVFLMTLTSNWNPLYRNNGDGTFTRIIEPSLQNLHPDYNWFFAWVDYDNDGYLDLLVPDWSALGGGGYRNFLLHNSSNGTFTRVTGNPIVQDGVVCSAGAWGDYDRDGDLDLLMARGAGGWQVATNCLYQNQGGGSFLKLTGDPIRPLISERLQHNFPTWVDVDDDGWQDLFVTVYANSANVLYLNQGAGGFVKVTDDPLVQEWGDWCAMGWADYDNDGDVDVFLTARGTPDRPYHPVALFRNEGGAHFRKMTLDDIGPLADELAAVWGCAWGDYDNDGWVDLIAANGVEQSQQVTPLFYRNNGDGTFTKVTAGSPANHAGACMAVKWVDYDQDGGLDLFITDHNFGTTWANRLFRNNGNANAWLEIQCVGTCSPRWGTGAKVRVKATIGGKERWQLRLIDTGGTPWGGQSFVAHFGLGDATVVETLRIEWTSGIVQELHHVAVKQHLTVTEPTKLEVTGTGQFRIRSWPGMAFEVQASDNLQDWQPVATVTNLTGVLEFTDVQAVQHAAGFYRAVQR